MKKSGKIFAGMNCIMALTEDGRVLQKNKNPEFAARTQYWTRIRQIAVSHVYEGLAIGLVEDGTCMVGKRALRYRTDRRNFDGVRNYDNVHERVRAWKGITQVAVSDAFFALDRDGRVHCSPLDLYGIDDYMETEYWRGIRKIVTGTQNAVFGITEDGRIRAAGGNLNRGYMRAKLSKETDVVDLFPTGSECEDVIVVRRDGIAHSLFHDHHLPLSVLPPESAEGQKILDGNFWYSVFVLTPNRRLCLFQDEERDPLFSGSPIRSFAVGHIGFSEPFVIAVTEDETAR